MAVADFNADGYNDVVVTNNSSNTIGVLLNNGDGTFATAVTSSTGSGSYPFGVTVGDFNADGKPDVAVTDSYTAYASTTNTGTVAVLLNFTVRARSR